MDVLFILIEAPLNLCLRLTKTSNFDKGGLCRGDGVGTYMHTIHRRAWMVIHPKSNYQPSLRNMPQTSRFNLKSKSDLRTPPPGYM